MKVGGIKIVIVELFCGRGLMYNSALESSKISRMDR